MRHAWTIFLLVTMTSLVMVQADTSGSQPDTITGQVGEAQLMSLLGEPLNVAAPSQESLRKLALARADYEVDPDNPDKLIWLGRRLAYAGDYRDAIKIFSKGIDKFPRDARMYRHRGHRFITVRDFGRAIKDLEYASKLVAGQPDTVEPDGLPNALNIPVSSLHTNIWYHLGLAYYLQQDWDNAWRAFQAGFLAGNNDDNRVSSTHWRYMILRRMGREKEAAAVVAGITPDMEVIENHIYHRLCLFYGGRITADEISDDDEDNPTNSAAAYGLANWALYNGDHAEGMRRMRALLQSQSWAAFGYIAAESEVASQH
jgi:TolA-binding protein